MAIVSLSLMGGLSEAVLLVLVVRLGLFSAGQLTDLGRVPLLDEPLSATVALVAAAVLGLANLGVHYLVARLSASLHADLVTSLRTRVLHAFVAASFDRQTTEREGSVHELVTVFVPASAQLAGGIVRGVAGGLHVVALLAVALAVDPTATILVIVSGLALFLSLRPIAAWTRRRSQASVSATSEFNTGVAGFVGMTTELRTFGVERAASRDLEEQAEEIGRRDRLTLTAARFGETLFRDLALLFLVGAVAVLYAVSVSEIAGIGAVVLLVVRAASSAQAIQEMRQNLGHLGPQFERLVASLESLELDRQHRGTAPIADVELLRFEQVEFRYDRAAVLSDLDLELQVGEVVGLVGPSGAGKSTLAQLVLGLRSPTSGRILADGRPLPDISVADWSRLVSFVPQEPRLIEGTVAHNIVFFRDGIGPDDVRVAATAAHIAADIEALPLGYDTPLGARGIGLSGGQKQRVAIARALAGHPRFIALDEPTSALDPASEDAVRETIRALRGVVGFLVIAHRPGVLEVCDRVVELRDGRIHDVVR